MARAKRLAKWIGLAAAGLLVLLALAGAVGYGYLQSDGGRERAARALERLISTPGELEVRIGRLGGRLPFAVSVDEVQVADEKGAWLAVDGLSYEIDPAALFEATLKVRSLAADRVRLDRLPESASSEPPEAGPPAWPTLPFAVWLERFAVGEVVLEPAVLGQAARFRVAGDATSRDGSDVSAAVSVSRSDGEAGGAEATLRYAFAERFLDIDARVEEPAGGLIVRALGLAGLPALEARLAGQGPLADWNGDLALTLEGVTEATAELRLRGTEDLDFSLAGSADTTAAFEELPWRLLRGQVAFEADGRWRAPATLVLERGHVSTPAVDLTASGMADLDSQTLDAKATAAVADLDILKPYLPAAEATGLRLALDARGRFDAPDATLKATAETFALDGLGARGVAADAKTEGPLAQPRLTLDLTVDRLTAPDLTADGVKASAAFAPDAEVDWTAPRGTLTTSGAVGRLEAAALGDWAPAAGQDLAWDLTAEVDAASTQVHNADVRLETGRGQLAGQGSFDWQSGATDARLQLSYPDLAPLGTVLGRALAGRLEAEAEITSAGPLGVFEAAVSGTLADLVLPEPIAQSLAAPTLEIGGRIARDRSGSIAVTALRAASPAATVTGDLELDPDLSHLAATYRAALADLAVLSPAVGQPLSGSAAVSGKASGSFESLEVTGDLEIPKGAVAGQPVESLAVAFTAAGLPERPNGQASARLKAAPVGDVSARARFEVADEAVELSALSLAAAGLTADGRARVPLDGAPVMLELDGRAESLSSWLALAGLKGDAKGPFQLALEPNGARQSGHLEATLEGLRLALAPDRDLSVGTLSATIDGTDLLGDATAEARLSATDLALPELSLTTAELEASGGPAGGDYRFTAAGDWRGDFRMDGAGRLALDGERVELEVSRLDGHALRQDLALKQAAQFVVDGASMSVSGLDLAFGEARLQGSAARAPDGLAADVTLTDLPVTALGPLVELPFDQGRAEARLTLSGPVAAPQGDLKVELHKLQMAEIREVPPVDVSFVGRWQDGVLSSNGRLSGLAKEDVVLSLDLPLRLDPETLGPVVPSDGPLAGKLVWQGPIGQLWDLVPADLHELSGIGDVRASVSGTVAQAELGGTFALSDGRYESLEAGTLLKNLELSGDLSDHTIQLTRLNATDGAKGKLEASGTVELQKDWGVSTNLTTKFEKFALLRRDDITAVGKGEIALTGTSDQSLIEGTIETDSVEIDIPDRMPPDVVVLNVEVAGATAADAAESAKPAAKPGGHRVAFDITIDIPRRAFIRGRGIDSEWAGTLKLAGTGDKMIIKGKLYLVRGQVAALGKTFRLDEGIFTFPGTASNDPSLHIVARRSTDDLDVTITVSGPLTNPKLTFTSVPELPEDEIISHVLFGKSTGQLSAIEAAQLAASVAELTGQTGGANSILGRIRSSLGVDVLRIESSETNDTTSPDVAAGKYLTDDIYIGAKQGTQADSGTAEIEVELTPNISVGSSVGQQGQSEVGVNFKWDY